MGLNTFSFKRFKKRSKDIDICINTIPYPIVNAAVIANMPAHTLIIDLASKPGGTDFRYAEKRGIKALLAPGLPGIVAPKTAGQILANVLVTITCKRLLKNERGRKNEFKRKKNWLWINRIALYV